MKPTDVINRIMRAVTTRNTAAALEALDSYKQFVRAEQGEEFIALLEQHRRDVDEVIQ